MSEFASLPSLLQAAASVDAAQRRPAGKALLEMSNKPGFVRASLELVANGSVPASMR